MVANASSGGRYLTGKVTGRQLDYFLQTVSDKWRQDGYIIKAGPRFQKTLQILSDIFCLNIFMCLHIIFLFPCSYPEVILLREVLDNIWDMVAGKYSQTRTWNAGNIDKGKLENHTPWHDLSRIFRKNLLNRIAPKIGNGLQVSEEVVINKLRQKSWAKSWFPLEQEVTSVFRGGALGRAWVIWIEISATDWLMTESAS